MSDRSGVPLISRVPLALTVTGGLDPPYGAAVQASILPKQRLLVLCFCRHVPCPVQAQMADCVKASRVPPKKGPVQKRLLLWTAQ